MDVCSDMVENIKACRTCGIHYVTPSENQLKHLFHSEILLIRLELSQWNIEVAENDGLPQYVCITCIHKFEQVFQLRAACINAQNEFRKFYAVSNGIPNVKIKTELPDVSTEQPICDFIYVDDLSDAEYDGATPFNYPHIPIKEEIIEAATIPTEELGHPTNSVESASRNIRTEPSSSHITELLPQNEIVTNCQAAAPVQAAPSEFMCKLCQYLCSNQEEYKQHMDSTHDIRDLECHICGKEFKNSTSARLKFHLKWHTLNKQIKCTLCGYVCNSKDGLRQHKRANHRKSNCIVCGKAVLVKKMKLHLRQHELSSKFPCEYCDKGFATENEREDHIWQIHANEDNNAARNSLGTFQPSYAQTITENSFNVPQENLCQTSQQSILFKFMCAQCGHRFIDQIDLETHVSQEHRRHLPTLGLKSTQLIEDISINQMAEEMTDDDDVNNHTNFGVYEEYDKKHDSLSDQPPNCIPQQSSVDYASTEEPDNENSETDINDELPVYDDPNFNAFACAKCSETFLTIQQLRDHHGQHLANDQQQQLEKDHIKLKFKCNLCGKYFDFKFGLNRHMKKHKHAPL